MSEQGGQSSGQVQPSVWRTLKMVAWSFFGVRKGSASRQDMARVSPYHIIAVGLGAAAFFVLILIALVNWVVAK